MIAVLFPRFDHPAIEERFASWQAETLLRVQTTQFRYYEDSERAADVAADVESELVLVVTDPLVLCSRSLIRRLAEALADADAVLPVTNESKHPRQQRAPAAPYMTLRELEETFTALEAQPRLLENVTWDDSDPAVYLCRTSVLDQAHGTTRQALRGRNVVISGTDYVHRWSSMRGQVRMDLLDRIDTNARSILEFGCGEAPLGAALKARQKCRVVGVELDREAAAIARRRIDDVYNADVREIVNILDEQFDWIVGGDIVEHLDDPWSFLSELRRLARPGGHLLLSLPNLANASVIGDLLQGRFDYVYMGLTCVGHVRFFTRRSIEEMLTMTGWQAVEITPQQLAITPQSHALIDQLSAANVGFSREDLQASGYYVVAQNR
ncbi:MAG TPA: class I SAM-dependent methyltransferase [Thermoanaerobaculia bacterium]|nr:class I SAM-dependent methyltransferase [Thermoanaerobaculia bacterium]